MVDQDFLLWHSMINIPLNKNFDMRGIQTMADNSGYLFNKDEIEKACALLEKLFGTEYFRKGTEILKDSDPSGAGMGRKRDTGSVSRLLLAWNRSMEDLAFANLSGFFKPGTDSAVIGILGKSLADLHEVPGIETAAGGLLNDTTFDRTVLVLSVAAGFNHSYESLCFPAGREDSFFIGSKYIVTCLQSEIPHPGVPLCSSHGDPLFTVNCYVLAPLLKRRHFPDRRKQLFYIDVSGLPLPLDEIGNLLSKESEGFFESQGTETAAIVLCKTLFSRESGGVRWNTSSYFVVNKKTSGLFPAEGSGGIYLP